MYGHSVVRISTYDKLKYFVTDPNHQISSVSHLVNVRIVPSYISFLLLHNKVSQFSSLKQNPFITHSSVSQKSGMAWLALCSGSEQRVFIGFVINWSMASSLFIGKIQFLAVMLDRPLFPCLPSVGFWFYL